MWHQVIVVENTYPEHCGVDANTQEEDTDETRHLVERNKTTGRKGMQVSSKQWFVHLNNFSQRKKGIKNTLEIHWFALEGFHAPHCARAYLNTNVVVLFFSHLYEDSKEGKDGVCAEEGALRPDYCCREEAQEHCQQPVETLPEHTLPVPLWGWQMHTHTHTGININVGGIFKLAFE